MYNYIYILKILKVIMSKIISSYIDEADYEYLIEHSYNVSKVVRKLVEDFVTRAKQKRGESSE